MYKLIGLYLLAVLGIFVEPEFLGSAGNIVFKLLILAGISYLVYEQWNTKPEDEEPEIIQPEQEHPAAVPEPVFDTIPAQLGTVFNNNDGLKQFLLNQFSIYWNYTLPQNGFLLYKDGSEKIQMLEQRTHQKIPFNPETGFTALISLLGQNEGILIENNLRDANALFPFYDLSEYQPQSLLAFQTQLDTQQVLYWFFDANGSNYFNIQDKPILLQINMNTIFAVNESLNNQGLIDNSKEVMHLSNLAHLLNQALNFEQCIDIFTDFIINEFEASKFTIAIREADGESARIRKSIGIEDSYKTGALFRLDEGLHGWVILKNKPYLIDNIDKGEYFIPRFSRAEKTNFSLRSFLSVPLQEEDEAFGMVSLENKSENKYTENDKSRLISLSTILASAFRRFKENKIEIGE